MAASKSCTTNPIDMLSDFADWAFRSPVGKMQEPNRQSRCFDLYKMIVHFALQLQSKGFGVKLNGFFKSATVTVTFALVNMILPPS